MLWLRGTERLDVDERCGRLEMLTLARTVVWSTCNMGEWKWRDRVLDIVLCILM